MNDHNNNKNNNNNNHTNNRRQNYFNAKILFEFLDLKR